MKIYKVMEVQEVNMKVKVQEESVQEQTQEPTRRN